MEPARPEIKVDTTSAEQGGIALRRDDGKWLDVTGIEIIEGVKVKVGVKVVDEEMPMEQATEVSPVDL